nr:MAG TPA: hypothetical protein [Caudoviricetes sp.]
MPFHDVTAATALYGVFSASARAMLRCARPTAVSPGVRSASCRPPPRRRQRRVDCTTAAISPQSACSTTCILQVASPLSPNAESGRALFKDAWLHGAQASNSAQPPHALPFMRTASATARSGAPATTALPGAGRADAAR